jgi:hypothetical protein
MARALGPWQSTRKGWSLPAKLQPFTPLSQRRCVYYSGIGPGQSEESEPHRAPLWELRPLIEAGAPSTGGRWFPECARPTGEVMVAPQTIPRNAEGVQSEGPGEMP